MPNIRWLLALITAIHRFVYKSTGGRLGADLGRGRRMLLLETRGRKSGLARTTPLLYVPDGDRWLVIGSNAGDHRNPAWFLNLRASGAATIQVGRERIAVNARTASGAEADELWSRFIATYAPYARYRERAAREIPIVVLERAKQPAPASAA